VRNTGTSYAAGSGVAAGTDAATLDTVIGQAGTHRLYIEDTSGTGASGTVRLNDGVKIDFTSADTNLQVQGPHGETVVLDMSNITAGFTGYVDITANGEMSIDDGTTFEAITFSDNQLMLHPDTNEATYVNSIGIRQAGTDYVEYTGTADAFQTLQDLAMDLRNSRNFNEGEWDKAISRRLGDLERIIDHFISISGQQSVTLQSLEAVEVRHEDVQLDTQRVISEIAATDTATAILTMQNTQNLLNLTYASSVRLMEQSLLDFLR
jgi:flagellin-like hook-associated protein FlgL